jgi:hypothetical protein
MLKDKLKQLNKKIDDNFEIINYIVSMTITITIFLYIKLKVL